MTNCSSPISIHKHHGLLRGFVLWLVTNFILGALYFTKARALFGGATMEAHMKFTIPGILITALIAGSPAALAQGMNYSGSSSNPATSVSKDETTGMTKRKKKHMVSHKHRHHAKAVSSKAQKSHAMSSKPGTTGSGSNTAKPEKDDTTPKSR